jgi:hypothetical protein
VNPPSTAHLKAFLHRRCKKAYPNLSALKAGYQRILGHTAVDRVNRYLAFAQADVKHIHRDASLVSNWCL